MLFHLVRAANCALLLSYAYSTSLCWSSILNDCMFDLKNQLSPPFSLLTEILFFSITTFHFVLNHFNPRKKTLVTSSATNSFRNSAYVFLIHVIPNLLLHFISSSFAMLHSSGLQNSVSRIRPCVSPLLFFSVISSHKKFSRVYPSKFLSE